MGILIFASQRNLSRIVIKIIKNQKDRFWQIL